MSKQSSIDWFHRETWKLHIQVKNKEVTVGEFAGAYHDLLKKAREMHRQEIIEAANNGCGEGMCSIDINRDGEHYYTQTFGLSDES